MSSHIFSSQSDGTLYLQRVSSFDTRKSTRHSSIAKSISALQTDVWSLARSLALTLRYQCLIPWMECREMGDSKGDGGMNKVVVKCLAAIPLVGLVSGCAHTGIGVTGAEPAASRPMRATVVFDKAFTRSLSATVEKAIVSSTTVARRVLLNGGTLAETVTQRIDAAAGMALEAGARLEGFVREQKEIRMVTRTSTQGNAQAQTAVTIDAETASQPAQGAFSSHVKKGGGSAQKVEGGMR